MASDSESESDFASAESDTEVSVCCGGCAVVRFAYSGFAATGNSGLKTKG